MSKDDFDISKFRAAQHKESQYQRQLERLTAHGKAVDYIEAAVRGALANLSDTERTAFVIFGCN
jgi:hypothetical protein